MTTTEESRRKPLWCGLVDKAIGAAAATGKPVDIERMLDRVGIFAWSPYRERAITYATKIIAASNGGSHDAA